MDRRTLLSLIAGTIAWPGAVRALPSLPPRKLRLVNAHTGETFDGFYRSKDGPVAPAMEELSVFLRDFHSDATIAIDVALLDFLAAVMDAAGQSTATVLSAYRTPKTNAMLARTHFGVAENSQHIYGRALDIHFGANLAEAMRAARGMRRGGVGWYPDSGFIHLDSGPVRNWDLDGNGFGALLVGSHKIRFAKTDPTVGSRTPSFRQSLLTEDQRQAQNVSQRLAELRARARAEYVHP